MAQARAPAGLELEAVPDRCRAGALHRAHARRSIADDPRWVQPLTRERLDHLDRRKNPFLRAIDVQYWIARRDGRPVGRISAQVNQRHLERHGDATGHFGFLDALDDPAVFALLLGAAEGWLRESRAGADRRAVQPVDQRRMRAARRRLRAASQHHDGPRPALLPPACRALRLRQGEGPDRLRLRRRGTLAAGGAAPAGPAATACRACASDRSTCGATRPRSTPICRIFNDAWADNWGFVPFGEDEARYLAKSLRPLVGAGSFAIGELDGEAVAFTVTLPNLNEAIAGLDGRLLPLGWARLLWRLKVRGVARPPACR